MIPTGISPKDLHLYDRLLCAFSRTIFQIISITHLSKSSFPEIPPVGRGRLSSLY